MNPRATDVKRPVMTPDIKRRVINLAETYAREWFRVQRESDVPELDPPDEVWSFFNCDFPENAIASQAGHTRIDRLFECAFRARMATLWQEEAELQVRRLLVQE